MPVKALDVAVALLENDQPLPVDLVAKLLEEGIDVSALEDQFN